MSFGDGNLHDKVDRLAAENAELTRAIIATQAELEQKRMANILLCNGEAAKIERIEELERLVRDMWAVIQRPYICVDVGVLSERMEELGIEVNGD